MFKLEAKTDIEIRKGLQSTNKFWNQIAFEYIGAKSPELKEVANSLEQTGKAEWNGFGLFHPLFER